MINVLYFIHSTVWKALFGKQADSLEKSTENEDECKIDFLGEGFDDLIVCIPLYRYDF